MGASSAEVRVLERRVLGSSGFLLTFERPPGFSFQSGQYLSLGVPGHREQREYSIYSGTQEPHLTVLIKEVEGGLVSRRLSQLNPGDLVHVDGPFGYFLLAPALATADPLLLVSTGTGISPFHSFIQTEPNLKYTLLHGVRILADTVLEEGFPANRMVRCVSRESGGDVQGRVTDALKTMTLSPKTHAFLCGNCDMIYEAFDLLRQSGISSERIYTEVYF